MPGERRYSGSTASCHFSEMATYLANRIAPRGTAPSCPGSDPPTIPATIWLNVEENEIPHVAHGPASFIDGHSEYEPAGVRISDLKAVLAQI